MATEKSKTLYKLEQEKLKEVKSKLKELINLKKQRLDSLDKKYFDSWENHPHQTKLMDSIEELETWYKNDLRYFN